MNRVGEDYCEALSPICLQSMRFLNTYASKVNVDREDVGSFGGSYMQVIALLLEFGLSPKLVPKVIDHVMQLSQEYHSIVDVLCSHFLPTRLSTSHGPCVSSFLGSIQCR